MTSIGSFVKQIPLNNGYFRPLPELAALLSSTGSTVNFMYNINVGTGAITQGFTAGCASTTAALNSGAALLKDMGTTYLSSQGNGNSSPIVFRRVQVVDGTLGAGLATDGVSGVFTGSAAYSADYNCAFILMGFNGAVPVGPFVRTG